MAGFKLIVTAGKDAGRALDVAGPELTPIKIGRESPDRSRDIELIGRAASEERDLLLSGDRLVSRVHLKIEAGPDGFLATDCQSVNRTRRNGQFLKPWEPVPLQHGDELRLGPDTIVRFELLGERTVTPPLASVTRLPTQAPPSDSRPDTPAIATKDGSVGPPKAAPAEPLVPGETWGAFAVVKTISQSAGARVDLAIHRDRNERVALKRWLRNQLSAKARSVLLAGAQKGRAWTHASIAEVLEHGERNDFVFLARRWVEGKSLRDLQLEHGDDIEIPLALHLTRDICAALRYAQSVERGFVWGNLNPRNVVVDRAGHAVLINFGLPSARLLAEGREPLDTPEARYLAPEQRHGKETDSRSDLYAAGVILYECLGRKPVDAGQKTLKDAVGLRKDIPWDVADAVNKAVAYRPERRFIHAADMEEALAALMQGLYPRYESEPAAWIADRLSEPGAE